ncbi:MAG: energy transducer TonB [Blastocatellia bacterium]
MSVLHGFIYSTPGAMINKVDRSGFFHRHKIKLGIFLSVFLHLSYFGWTFYQAVFSPFTNISMIDDAYNEIKWIELTKLTKPLKYPPNMLVVPKKAVPLDKIAEELAKEEEKKKEEAKRKAEERKKKKEAKENELKEDSKEDIEEENQDTDLAKNEVEVVPEDTPAPTGPPRFGQINARPIREIMGKVYNIYKSGNLDIQKAFFSVTVGYEVGKDGSLYEIRIIKSSGSEQLDTAAINIANAISESHALLPLTALTANTATLELGDEKASFIIRGQAANTSIASDLANLFSQQVAGLRLLLSFKNPEAAVLFAHLKISNQGNELIADMTMARQEADEMMHRNFQKNNPVENSDQNPSTNPPNPTNDDKVESKEEKGDGGQTTKLE